MLKTINRLIQFIQYKGLSARQFDLSIGASNGYTLRMKKNNASVGSDVIENIIRKYPQLNLIWLITGKGEMLNAIHGVSDFDTLPQEKQSAIERIIAQKIKERQKEELQRLVKEVMEEIHKTKG